MTRRARRGICRVQLSPTKRVGLFCSEACPESLLGSSATWMILSSAIYPRRSNGFFPFSPSIQGDHAKSSLPDSLGKWSTCPNDPNFLLRVVLWRFSRGADPFDSSPFWRPDHDDKSQHEIVFAAARSLWNVFLIAEPWKLYGRIRARFLFARIEMRFYFIGVLWEDCWICLGKIADWLVGKYLIGLWRFV